MAEETFVIVGAGLAGAKAAEELRVQGFDGRVVLVGDERERPYERPPLSKGFLRGEEPEAKVFVHPAGFYDQQGIELITGLQAVGLDLAPRAVRLATGESLHYDRLLLASGAAPRRLPVPGADLPGVRYLRTLSDSRHLADELGAAERVVVVGGGWIGSEVAASARAKGVHVTVIEPGATLLERVLGPRIGSFYTDLHRSRGVDLRLGASVSTLDGDARVRAVQTTLGETIPADLVVVGIGAAPRSELAESAGLDVADGVVVDSYLRTSNPNVFAAGDVARAWHPFYRERLRVEHWANALNQGQAAAANMLDREVVYDRVPYFFSDQYDVGMEYSGHAGGATRTVVDGDVESGAFVAYWLDAADRVVAAMSVNTWDVVDGLQALIRSRRPVDPLALEGATPSRRGP